MNLKCLIVDDEQTARNILKRYVSDVPGLSLAGECANAIQAPEFLSKTKIDILFLDIEMPKLSGLDFIRTLQATPHIIITTAYREFALDGFELNVQDYLVKPIPFERFLTSINRITERQKVLAVPRDYLYLRAGKRTFKFFARTFCI